MTQRNGVPVTGTVIAKDLAERAIATFIQAAIPSLILAFSATSWSQAKALGLAAAAAGGAAVLSLVKGLLASYVTGTASFARQVAESSTSLTPPPSPEVYGGPATFGTTWSAGFGDENLDSSLDQPQDNLDEAGEDYQPEIVPSGEIPESAQVRLSGTRPAPTPAE